MPQDRGEIVKLHSKFGLEVTEIVPSATAQKRFTPYKAPIFREDVFVTAAIQQGSALKPHLPAAV